MIEIIDSEGYCLPVKIKNLNTKDKSDKSINKESLTRNMRWIECWGNIEHSHAGGAAGEQKLVTQNLFCVGPMLGLGGGVNTKETLGLLKHKVKIVDLIKA